MTISELGAIGEFLGSIAVLITLIYLAVQVRQNTRHVKAQMGHDGWLSVAGMDLAVLGDNAGETLAKAELENEHLTDKDLKVLDAYFKSIAMHLGRVEHLHSQGLEIYTVEQTALAFIHQLNCPAGKAWWESNQSYVNIMAPKIGARISEMLAESDSPSRAESFKEFKHKLTSKHDNGKSH